MQHLKELGTGGGNTHFVGVATSGKGKAKKTMNLEDALRKLDLDGDQDVQTEYSYGVDPGMASTYDWRSTTSSYVREPTYQDQQDIPDAIAGFQPNMDSRLRETLEALDDEAFVDNEIDGNEDIFAALTKDADEMEPGEWEDTIFDNAEEDDEGWESDVTEKAVASPSQNASIITDTPLIANHQDPIHQQSVVPPLGNQEIPDTTPENGSWLREFAKFKKSGKPPAVPVKEAQTGTETTSQHFPTAGGPASTIFTAGGTPIRCKKRKGALTNPSAYSMTSSSLARTEGLRLLDDRFEKIEALYALDEEDEGFEDEFDGTASMTSGMTGMSGVSSVSQAPSLVSISDVPLRQDFDDVMDSFLAGWQDRSSQARRKGAKGKRGKNGNEVLGIQVLDEIRQGLGPARVPRLPSPQAGKASR